MEEQINDPNCIVKAFEKNSITIIKDENKFYFRGTDVAKTLGITNIRSSIQNFTDQEKGVRKCTTLGGPQDIIFLSSHGVYRLLYSSKKKIAEEFREWVGNIMDDLIFNHGKNIKLQLEEKEKLLQEKEQKLIDLEQELKQKDYKIMEITRRQLTKYDKLQSVYIGTDNKDRSKIGNTKDQNTRVSTYKVNNPNFNIHYIIPCNDYLLIERIIKHILKQHTLENYNEWFNISCNKLKVILETIIYIVDDAMKIENVDNLYNIFTQLHTITYTISPEIENKVSINTDTLLVEQDILNNKHFTCNLYKRFIDNNCEISPDRNYRTSTEDLMNEFKKSLQNTEYKERVNSLYNTDIYTKKTYNFLNSFKVEFYDNISKILNTEPIDYQYTNNKLEKVYARGFNGVIIKNKESQYIIKKSIYEDFFVNNIEKCNTKDNKIKTLDILKKFEEYIKLKNLNIDKKLIVGNDTKRHHGYNLYFKNEILSFLISKYNVKEQRIRFDLPLPNSIRGFYYLKFK